jgi:hypothetical protein
MNVPKIMERIQKTDPRGTDLKSWRYTAAGMSSLAGEITAQVNSRECLDQL